MPETSEGRSEKYINPVYPLSFPDPFVLKFRGEYFAYCTGDAADGNVFGILRSDDLVNWSYAGSAMEPLASRPPYYWAPEVNYDNGKFYLYYSTGNEILMEIRVAVSDRPDGGFVDAGVRLTHEEFAIDAHIFIDDDGSRYLFYATDFLEYSNIGTGTVVDRMIDWKTLEGKPRPITRAKYDWQIYDPARKEKGGVRWYTVEGPTVLKRKGKYFEMFSGGNWQNRSYGVSFAVSDSMSFTDEWQQFSDGEKILPILRTIPGKVIGPGHNSVVRGPNNRELYCIYHKWTEAGRVLAIDRMDFAGDRLFVAGPTTTEQYKPFRSLCGESLIKGNATGWSRDGRDLVSSDGDRCEFVLSSPADAFRFECSFRCFERAADSRFIILFGETEFELLPAGNKASLRSTDGAVRQIKLLPDFDPAAFHLLRVDVDGELCRVMIDNIGQTAEISSSAGTPELLIIANHLGVVLSAMELTPGFEELFEKRKIPERLRLSGKGRISNGSLIVKRADASLDARAAFLVPFPDLDLSVNLANEPNSSGQYGIELLDKEKTAFASLTAKPDHRKIEFRASGDVVELDLPDSFVGSEIRQFRIVRKAGRLSSYLDGIFLADLPIELDVSEAAIFGTDSITIEMIRLTAI